MIFALKISKIPEFYMISARKVPEFYIINTRKYFSRFFLFFGGGVPPAPRLPRLWFEYIANSP